MLSLLPLFLVCVPHAVRATAAPVSYRLNGVNGNVLGRGHLTPSSALNIDSKGEVQEKMQIDHKFKIVASQEATDHPKLASKVATDEAAKDAAALLKTNDALEKATPKDSAPYLDLHHQAKQPKTHDSNGGVFFPWWVTRHPNHLHEDHHKTVAEFLETAGAMEVGLIISTLVIFVWTYGFFLKWPDARTPHWVLLGGWLIWGIFCTSAVYVLQGSQASTSWMVGYMLELVFSVENVFVFHVVCQAFRAPTRWTQKALLAVIVCQIAFQALFFMGLAHWIHQSRVLPYILGVWLLYVGWHASKGHSEEDDFDARESSAFKFLHWIMGRRLSPAYTNDGRFFFQNDGLISCSMLLPLTLCLIVVDIAFEVDVTLTKIETLSDTVSDFSSSVVAAVAVPELYFVARKMFERYEKLQYGVAFILLFYGVQLLLHNVYQLPAVYGIGVVVGVMIICIVLSEDQPVSKAKLVDDRHDEQTPDVRVKQLTDEANDPTSDGIARRASPV